MHESSIVGHYARDEGGDVEIPRIYRDFGEWWPLFSPPSDYEEEATFYQRELIRAAARPLETMIELGSGGGNNASYLKKRFAMTLVEPSSRMLEVSRRLNPECEHVQGDMRTVRLGRQFDAVFVHDAVVYMTTEADLKAAIATAFVHCAPGGAALFAPDHVRETFAPSTDHGGEDGDGRSLRYLEWTWDPDPADTQYSVDYAFLLREPDLSVRVVHDRHVEGLFARSDWLRWLAEAGFDPEVVPFDHSELEPGQYEIFVARRPGTAGRR
jgi:trans-aconitate methyltransferase